MWITVDVQMGCSESWMDTSSYPPPPPPPPQRKQLATLVLITHLVMLIIHLHRKSENTDSEISQS